MIYQLFLLTVCSTQTLEYVSEEYGGRVDLAKAYYKGLTNSLLKNFKGTGLFSSMQQCNDFFYLGTKQNSIGRVGKNFNFFHLFVLQSFELLKIDCNKYFGVQAMIFGSKIQMVIPWVFTGYKVSI